MTDNKPLIAHLSMLGACTFWGLMAPLGKDAMTNGIDGLQMVVFRVLGGALLFGIASIFAKKEEMPRIDKLKFAGAAIFGLLLNQCCFIIGLSITSPGNASIMTTSMPIFAMLLSFIILHEPLTGKKIAGVLTGCTGALILILTSAASGDAKVGNIKGDLLCLFSQFSYALYLSLFNPLVRKYSVFTINKWMFMWASLFTLPFAWHPLSQISWQTVPQTSWWEAAYVVVFGTFLSYILTMVGQRTLRPTVVSSYNYVQPLVAVSISIVAGISVFKWSQALAVLLVFYGVWMVTKSKSKKDCQKSSTGK